MGVELKLVPPPEEGHAGLPGVFPYAGRTFLNAACLALAESFALILSFLVAGLVRWLWQGESMYTSWMPLLILAWLAGAYITRLLPGWGLGAVEELRRIMIVLMLVYAGTTVLLFWSKSADAISRITLTSSFFASLFLLPLLRTFAKRFLIKSAAWGCPTVIYSDAETAPRIIRALQDELGLGYLPAGVFLHSPGPSHIGDTPVLGNHHQNTMAAPFAIIALPASWEGELADLLDGPLSVYHRVVIIPDLVETPSLWVKPRDLIGTLGLEISVNLLDGLPRFFKRCIDVSTCLLTAPLWIPLFALTSLLIWLEDRGTPFFTQERLGRNGLVFRTIKFRTMYPDAEAILEKKLEENAGLREEWSRNFKLKKDPRITRVGAALRRMSLDELPQLINVLRGEMSLIGPRPLPRYHYESLPERARHLRDRVRPGITGLWQVNCRSESGVAGMAKWDAYYVRNWSIWLDIVILVRTFRAVVGGRGAY